MFIRCGKAMAELARIRQSGNGMIELIVVMPVILALSLGVFEVARAFHSRSVVIHAARDGARSAMDPTKNDAAIAAVVNASAAPLVPSSILVTRSGNQVSVRVTKSFQSTVGYLPGPWGDGTVTLQSTAVSRV